MVVAKGFRSIVRVGGFRNELYLEVYFDKEKPNLADDYNVEGLQLVIKENDSDKFILQDAKDRFYLWDAWDCELLRVADAWTQGFKSIEQVMENLIIYMSLLERDAVAIWRDRKED